jgi:hypothetical protein
VHNGGGHPRRRDPLQLEEQGRHGSEAGALTEKVEKHNQLIERTYRLEEGLSVVRNDIENLQRKVG